MNGKGNPDGAVVILSGAALAAAIIALLAARPAKAAPENEKLDYLIDLQTTMVQELQKLVVIGEQLIGEVPIVIEPKIVPGLVSVPLDPEMINRALQAMGLKGKTQFPNIKHFFACPAGTTTEFPLGLPTGYYCTCCLCTISSDYYHPDISVKVYVDDEDLTPWGYCLTGPSTLCYGEYHVKKRLVLYEVTNNTTTDAGITVAIEPICLVEKGFYEEFYVPIIEYMAKALKGVAYGQA